MTESKAFDSYVEKLMSDWRVPGLAIAIVERDETSVKVNIPHQRAHIVSQTDDRLPQNYGFADLEEGRLVDNETIFDCASTSKPFTAAAVALVLEDEAQSQGANDNCCDFDAPVNYFLPDDFVLEDQFYTANVTIEDILSHRSGMPRHDDSYLGVLAKEQDTPYSITRNLRNLSLTKPLRTSYQYCNMMYTVATHLVSQVSGSTFDTFLHQRILDPLGMDNTYVNVPGIEQYDSLKSRMATGYYYSEGTQWFKAIPFVDQSEAIGAGSIFSSVSDYARWLRCMMGRTLPLSNKSHQELVKPRIITEPEKNPEHGFGHGLYALGWEVKSYRGHRIIWHDGCVWGFNSSLLFLPALNWGMVVFCNGNEGANCNGAIVMTLLDDLLGLPAEERLDWNNIKRKEFEKCEEDSAADEAKEDERDDAQTLNAIEPLKELPLAAYVGVYHNQGYHDITLQLENGMLVADCTDRTFQFYLHIQKQEGNHFICRLRDNFDCTETKIKVRFRHGDSDEIVLQLGINFEPDLNDLIWFDKVAEL